jgi:hypothetical protein
MLHAVRSRSSDLARANSNLFSFSSVNELAANLEPVHNDVQRTECKQSERIIREISEVNTQQSARWSPLNEKRLHNAMMEAEQLVIRKIRMAERRQGGWRLQVFGIGKQFGGMPHSKLIHPQSPFATAVLIASAICLMYTAIISAFYFGFLWETNLCDYDPPTLYLDMLVDVFFIFEVSLNFFMGTYIDGEYTDSMPRVAYTYAVRGGFVFDFFTSIPVAFVEYFLIQQCADAGEGGSGVLRIMRTSKALRVARLIRAFKIIARLRTIAGFMSFLAAYLRIPGYILRVLQVGFLLGMLIHLCSCAFWLIKV